MSQEAEYRTGKELMEVMIEKSQRPGEGNQEFVDSIGEMLDSQGFHIRTVQDPEYADRSLLVAEVGDVQGEQTISAISHSDVVGVEGQHWKHTPWRLHEQRGNWFGRGACDTHGSGVSMLIAAARPEVRKQLEEANKKVSVIFTYDEEATSPELSMRGARLAAGVLGDVEPVATSKYFIAGEPTEHEGAITAMRAHKGRWLAHFTVDVEHSGHVSELVQNAFMTGSSIVHDIGRYMYFLTLGSDEDEEAAIFSPPHSTIQVSAAQVKSGDYSTTPSTATFTVDMRTLPFSDIHHFRELEVRDLIKRGGTEDGHTVTLDIVKNALGTVTRAESPIVLLAEQATHRTARGFNGGDEGRIMRQMAQKEGVTIGPGELGFAHMPDERVAVSSIFKAADIYADMFAKSVRLS